MAEHDSRRRGPDPRPDDEASLDAWMQALHGDPMSRRQDASDADDRLLAQQLGQAYRRQAAAAHEPRLPEQALRQAELLARAKALGLLEPRRTGGELGWRALLRPWGPLPVAASALLILFVLVWPEDADKQGDIQGDKPPQEAWRGADQPSTVLLSAQPRQARDEAQRRLTAAGLQVGAFEQPGAFGLEVDVPATPDAAMTTALRAVFERLPPVGSQRLLYRDTGPEVVPGASAASATKPAQ